MREREPGSFSPGTGVAIAVLLVLASVIGPAGRTGATQEGQARITGEDRLGWERWLLSRPDGTGRFWRRAWTANRNVAKQTCSCIFVGERTLNQCIADIPPDEAIHVAYTQFELTRPNGSSPPHLETIAFGLLSAIAVHDDTAGCLLLPPGHDPDRSMRPRS